MNKILISLAIGCALSLGACGDDDGNGNDTDGGNDATTGDTGVGEDSSTNDDSSTGDDASPGDIMVTTSVTEAGSPASDVVVEVLDADGNTLSTAAVDGSGNVTIGAPRDALFFLFVQPSDDAMGTIRVQQPASEDYTLDGGLAMEDRTEYETRLDQAGITLLPSGGNVVVGFNVADSEKAGETASLGGALDDNAFVIKSESSVLVQNSVPPLCTAAEEPCREIEGRTEVFFANVEAATVTPSISGGEGTCTVRHHDGAYPVRADSRTIISVDCE